jgi:predicted transcriptional regulator
MSTPTAKQAQIFWLAATGMNSRQISEVVGSTPQAVQFQLATARSKAVKVGLKYSIAQEEEEEKVGSKMLRLKELAQDAGLMAVKSF